MNKHRHVHFEFERGEGIAIQTVAPIEKVIERVKNPNNWKFGVVPAITRVWEEWW